MADVSGDGGAVMPNVLQPSDPIKQSSCQVPPPFAEPSRATRRVGVPLTAVIVTVANQKPPPVLGETFAPIATAAPVVLLVSAPRALSVAAVASRGIFAISRAGPLRPTTGSAERAFRSLPFGRKPAVGTVADDSAVGVVH